jgi:hypothetical protein
MMKPFDKSVETSPAFQQQMRALRRCLRRHPYTHAAPGYLWQVYADWGRLLGGRPRTVDRCTKRLGTRLCWNWRVEGTTRCWRHQPAHPKTSSGLPLRKKGHPS